MGVETGETDLLKDYGASLSLDRGVLVGKFAMEWIMMEAKWLASKRRVPVAQIVNEITLGYCSYKRDQQVRMWANMARLEAWLAYEDIKEAKFEGAAVGISERQNQRLAYLGKWYVLCVQAFYALNKGFNFKIDLEK